MEGLPIMSIEVLQRSIDQVQIHLEMNAYNKCKSCAIQDLDITTGEQGVAVSGTLNSVPFEIDLDYWKNVAYPEFCHELDMPCLIN